MYLTWGNGLDIHTQLESLTTKWDAIFKGQEKSVRKTKHHMTLEICIRPPVVPLLNPIRQANLKNKQGHIQ